MSKFTKMAAASTTLPHMHGVAARAYYRAGRIAWLVHCKQLSQGSVVGKTAYLHLASTFNMNWRREDPRLPNDV